MQSSTYFGKNMEAHLTKVADSYKQQICPLMILVLFQVYEKMQLFRLINSPDNMYLKTFPASSSQSTDASFQLSLS